MKLNKLFAALLAAALLLSSCGGTDPSEENSPAEETQAAAPTELCLFENGQSAYTVIAPDRCSETVSSLVSFCWKTFAQTYEAEIGIANDWTEDPSALPEDACEILIGNTNRPATAEVLASMDNLLYRVTCVNNSIVVAAINDTMLEKAVNAFLAAVVVDENGRVTVPTDLNLQYTVEESWSLTGVPIYEGGTIAGSTLLEPLGFAGENPSQVLCIKETTAEAFANYIKKLENDGFTIVQRADWDKITAYQCDKEGVSVYTYFTTNTNEARIILDNSDTASLEEFNYTYEAADGETNDLFQFGMQAPIYTAEGEEIAGVGEFMFIKLADNSIVIIDGGHDVQPNHNEFLRIAREITGTPENEKVRIACWFITHCHGDHTNGTAAFLKNYSDQISVERILYNYAGGREQSFRHIYPDVIYHMPRTGETIQLGNLTMDIMYTHEDFLDPTTVKYITDEYNDTGTVMKIHFDGKSAFILGDIDQGASRVIRNMYSADDLKTDVVQVAHHGLNSIHDLYAMMDAPIAFIPAQEGYAKRGVAWNSVTSISEQVYCCDNTIGLRVVDGELAVVYEAEAVFNN